MSERSVDTARIVSSVAATAISLACGSNYVYSAWAPQFAERLKLSSTESNLIGLAGNFGMYALGIPIGMFVDARGSRPAVLGGSVLLAAGYFPLRQAYIAGSGSVALLCFYSILTGLGGCAAFQAAIKTSALNWPHHRGTATAFPLAAFGLSAFFFSVFSQFVFPGDTGDFLMLLAAGAFGLTFVGFFFLRVLPTSTYTAVPGEESAARRDSNQLKRTKSEESRIPGSTEVGRGADEPETIAEASEACSLMSRDSSSTPGDVPETESHVDRPNSHHTDIRGFKLCKLPEFWFLFSLMGILTGIGLMTINNIGNDVTALWKRHDPAAPPVFLSQRQALHVSILSICSFLGRLVSGIGADFITKRLHASRQWCVVISALIFSLAQICAVNISNPYHLFLVSSLTGLAYGFLFGCYPSIVAETFGVHGLSQNWGTMTIAPVFSGNVFNLFYGMVFDAHSEIRPGGERVCDEGLDCYRAAYLVTLGACVLGLGVSLWSIAYSHRKREKEAKEREDIARVA